MAESNQHGPFGLWREKKPNLAPKIGPIPVYGMISLVMDFVVNPT